jgi:hypothetical protein
MTIFCNSPTQYVITLILILELFIAYLFTIKKTLLNKNLPPQTLFIHSFHMYEYLLVSWLFRITTLWILQLKFIYHIFVSPKRLHLEILQLSQIICFQCSFYLLRGIFVNIFHVLDHILEFIRSLINMSFLYFKRNKIACNRVNLMICEVGE